MMDCSGIADHLSPLLDGELEGDKAESVREHLAKCPRCSKSLREHMSVKHLLAQKLLIEKPPPGLRSAILDRLDSSPFPNFFNTLFARLRARPLVAWATIVVLFLGALASALLLLNSYRFPSVIQELLAHHATGYQLPLDVVSANAGHVARKMSQSLGREVGVSDLKSKWCFLMGARKCPICRNDAVEIRYLHPAGNLSFFMVLNAGQKAIAMLCSSGTLQEKRIDGARYLYCEKNRGKAILWWEGDDLFALTSGVCLPSIHLFDIARQIRSDCRQNKP